MAYPIEALKELVLKFYEGIKTNGTPTLAWDKVYKYKRFYYTNKRHWSPFDHDVISIVGRESETIRGMTYEY